MCLEMYFYGMGLLNRMRKYEAFLVPDLYRHHLKGTLKGFETISVHRLPYRYCDRDELLTK
jgi:hypothetical protein